jgi:TonB family protein
MPIEAASSGLPWTAQLHASTIGYVQLHCELDDMCLRKRYRASTAILCVVTGCVHNPYVQMGSGPTAGRYCNPALSSLGFPTLGEVIDSTLADGILAQAGPSAERVTAVLRYAPSGSVDSVVVQHAASPAVAEGAATQLKAAIHVLSGYPPGFTVQLHRTPSGLRLLAVTVTCVPDRESTESARQFLEEAERFRPTNDGPRSVRFEFILEPTGQITSLTMVESTGIRQIDALAMQALTAMRWQPALVGSDPVPTLTQQPFQFR